MPTPIDRAMQSRNLFLGFAGIIGAVGLWNVWNGDVFPAEADPTGDPEYWTETELRRWLKARNLFPAEKASREELVERVKANLRAPKPSKE